MLRPLDALQVDAFLNHLPERTVKTEKRVCKLIVNSLVHYS